MSMGNGDRSMAQCYDHINRLMELHSKLSGLQQLRVSEVWSEADVKKEWNAYDEEANSLLVDLERDLLAND